MTADSSVQSDALAGIEARQQERVKLLGKLSANNGLGGMLTVVEHIRRVECEEASVADIAFLLACVRALEAALAQRDEPY